MKTFEQVTNWEFRNRGKLVRKLTQDQICIIADLIDDTLDCRVGDVLIGMYSYPLISQICPKYPKDKLVIYRCGDAIFIQVHHKKMWDGPLGTAPGYDRIVNSFTKFLNSN